MVDPHEALMFAAAGMPAVYEPHDGDAIACRVIPVTGTLDYGGVIFPADGLCFDALADQVPPLTAAGATLTVDGRSYPLAMDHLPLPAMVDPLGSRRRILADWGRPLVYHAGTSTGGKGRPPTLVGRVLATDAAAGDTVVTFRANYAAGRLEPGDRLEIAGAPYTVADAVSALDAGFRDVAMAITPPLDADFPAGSPIDFIGPAGEYRVLGSLRKITAEDRRPGIEGADAIAVIPHAQFIEEGWTDIEPETGHWVSLGGSWRYTVTKVACGTVRGEPVAWELHLKGG